MSDYNNPIWSIVANIVREHRAEEAGHAIKIGTRKFHGGAKVYIAGAFWGMGGENVTVIGRYRGKAFIRCTINAIYLENFRVKLAYNPEVIRCLVEAGHAMGILDNSQEAKLKAQEYSEIFARNSAYWRQQKLGRWAVQKLQAEDD
jgi:hypothetical protein